MAVLAPIKRLALHRTPERHWHIHFEEEGGKLELAIPSGARVSLTDFEVKT
jgi:hypothetical protein